MKLSRGWAVGRMGVALTLGLVVRAADTPAAGVAVAPSPPVASLAELRSLIERHITQPRFEGAFWGVKVVSLDTGRTLYEHGANLRLSPASNSKLYAGALALDALGGDARIRTPILATAAVDAAGDLAGDVIVSGRGDPSWNPRRSGGEFAAVFAPFVAVLQRAGVRRIAGDVVADATFFRGPPYGAGWTAEDLDEDYGAEISAITLDDNYVDLRVTPGATVGAPCRIEVVQPHSELEFDNRTVTVAAGGAWKLTVLRLPGETTVRVFGELPLGGKPELTEATVQRTEAWFAAGLKAALERAGIPVAGAARGVRWPEASATGAVRIGEVESPPLREMVKHLMKVSQNQHTDLVFAYVGEARRTPETPATTWSEALAVGALREFLGKNGLREREVIFEEGSGLSRNNLTTAAATVALLEFMAKHREAAAFAEALPLAGVDGSLRRRMLGTAAEGKVRAKTGTLRWAAGLSGYVTAVSGERLAFSLMLNRHRGTPERPAGRELDEIAVLLARFSGQ